MGAQDQAAGYFFGSPSNSSPSGAYYLGFALCSADCNTAGTLVAGPMSYFYSAANAPLSFWEFAADRWVVSNDFPVIPSAGGNF